MDSPEVIFDELERRMRRDDGLFGEFASTHEAMGVAMEEWDEFRQAIRSNDVDEVQNECLDLIVVLLRLHRQLEASEALRKRSGML